MIKLIINEDHQLLPEQERMLNAMGEKWERVDLPREGLTARELEDLGDKLWAEWCNDHSITIVMVSPVAYLVKLLLGNLDESVVRIMFNPTREKKELPNGKIIFTIPKTGWELV